MALRFVSLLCWVTIPCQNVMNGILIFQVTNTLVVTSDLVVIIYPLYFFCCGWKSPLYGGSLHVSSFQFQLNMDNDPRTTVAYPLPDTSLPY
jgi:sensor histidine kinase YesM